MKCYSTVHLTTRLLRHEPGRREAAAYHFGLPAYKPLMSQLIVKRLSRHKHFRDMISRRDCSVWNSRSIRPLAWGMLVVLDLPNHGWREASIWILLRAFHLRYIKTLSYAKHKVSCCRCKKGLLNVMNKQRVLSKKLVSRGVECYNWRNVLYL